MEFCESRIFGVVPMPRIAYKIWTSGWHFETKKYQFLTFSESKYLFTIWILIVLIFGNKLKKTFCLEKLYWPIYMALVNFKSFSQSLEHFFLTVGTILDTTSV